MEKQDTWKNIIIVLLLLAVIGLGGYVCYDKLFKGNNSTENKKTDNEEVINKEEKDEEKLDVVKVNEQLEKLNVALHFALDFESIGLTEKQTYWYLPENIKYNTELLDTEAKKHDFVFGSLVLMNIKDLKAEETPEGEEVTGSFAIPFDTYGQYYKDIIGSSIIKKTKYPSNESEYIVSKGNVYGIFWSGYGPLGTILKYKSFEEKDGEYTLFADVITYTDEEYEDIMKYDEYDVVEYSEDVISYKLKLVLTKVNDELYTIKSIQVIK